VIVKQENEEAKGDYAIYNLGVEKINLKGNVSLTKEESILTGDELTLDLINSTSIIKSNQENKVKAKIIK
jgi:lipopolysaccharide export system protein LptA